MEETGLEKKIYSDPNYVRAKGILEQVEYFDAFFFGYSPSDAKWLDPQVRIFTECVWHALEDAGYDPHDYNGSIGLYAGAAPNYFWESQVFSANYQDDSHKSGLLIHGQKEQSGEKGPGSWF